MRRRTDLVKEFSLHSPEELGRLLAAEASKDSHQRRTDPERARVMIEQGALLNEKYEGWTPLLWSVEQGHKDIFDALLAAPRMLDLDATDERGWTALMHAAHKGRRIFAPLLVSAGAGRVDEALKLTQQDYIINAIHTEIRNLKENRSAQADMRALGVISRKVVVLRDAFPPRNADAPEGDPAPVYALRRADNSWRRGGFLR